MDVGERPVGSIMKGEVRTVDEGERIDDVLQSCSSLGVTDLVVVSPEGRFEGVVTSTEILNYINPLVGVRTGRKLGHHFIMGECPRVSSMMSRTHATVRKDTPLSTALRHMRKDHRHYLVVLDESDRVVGRLDLCDVISHLIEAGVIVPSSCEL